MKYIKAFNNSNDLEIYRKSKFVSPHLFLNKQNVRDIHYLEEYEQLEYISSTATGGQYIDLGCQLMNSTDDIKIDIKFNIRGVGKSSSGNDTNLATLIGSQSESGSPWPGFILRRRTANGGSLHLQAKWAFTNSQKQNNANKWDSKYLSYTGNDQRTWQTIYEFSETLDNIPLSQVNDCTCSLFCAFDGNGNPFRYALADLYYLKLTKGNTVIRNLIPVRRKSDHAVGLYDIENDHLYVSQGNNPFVAGCIYDHKILYLESTKQQYINLDYPVWNFGLRCEMTIQSFDDSTVHAAYIGRITASGYNLYFNNQKVSLWVKGDPEIILSSNNIDLNNNDIHHIIFDINNNETLYLKVDNDEYVQNYSKNLIDIDKFNIQLFSHRGTNYLTTGRIYSCKLWFEDTLIYDLIPVRKDGIGYMYDKLSKKIFGNSATSGDPFILGPDI